LGEEHVELTERHREYWRKNVRMTIILLAIWAIITYVVGFYARELSFNFFGWPFSFWVGAQGALILYVVIIGFYAWYMNRLDNEYGVAEGEE
jgi:putative solute:sodium symporter small subunit